MEVNDTAFTTQMDYQIPTNYVKDAIKVDDIEDLPNDQILVETVTMNNKGSQIVNDVKAENCTKTSTSSSDIWLPQPIYPNSELPAKLLNQSPGIIKLDNSAKKKNVQNWLQKITQPSKPSTIQKQGTVHSNIQTNSILKQQFPVDYYGGDYGGDVRL